MGRRAVHAESPGAWIGQALLYGLEHAAVTVVAGDDRGAGHAHDRRVLPAVGAYGHELIALQAVHTAVTPGNRCRPEPRLATPRALGPEPGPLCWFAHSLKANAPARCACGAISR